VMNVIIVYRYFIEKIKIISKGVQEAEKEAVETSVGLTEMKENLNNLKKLLEDSLRKIETLSTLSLKTIIDQKIKNFQPDPDLKFRQFPNLPHYTEVYNSFMEAQKAVLDIKTLDWTPVKAQNMVPAHWGKGTKDKNFEIEVEFLSQMKNLPGLRVYCVKVSQREIDLLAKSISKLKNITILDLCFFSPTNPNDSTTLDMNHLAEAISKLKKLETFHIDLCNRITSAQLEPILKALIKLSELGKLKNVEFSYFNNLSYSVMNNLCNTKQALKKIIPDIKFTY
ncbi:MAG: hypothetical protein Q4E61_03620, partial [Alphaproteobacteria bacterium]|nr:hypothetical protein [Alphaproteobacteria bacterium]